jgi:nicotinate-nucleotide adenylyltransferase
MVRLLVDGDARFDVSPVEVERAGLSFTVDTLTHFDAVYPAAERFLLVGADVLATFAQWREPERVLQLARPVVLERDGEGSATLPAGVNAGAILRLPTRRVDVSSTEIRERVRGGKSIRGFVTDSVAAYIARAGLYR